MPPKEYEIDESIISDIEEHGLSVIHIPEDEYGPGYAFSIGLFQKHNHPEIITFGLGRDVMHTIINNIGHDVRQKKKYEADKLYDDILGEYDCTFRPVEKDWYASYLGYAQWFYKTIPFPVFQCVWPDKKGGFPWENPKASINRLQPLLFGEYGRDPLVKTSRKWPFNDDSDLAVFTCQKVLDKENDVCLVTHDFDDGSWQFLDECDHLETKPVLTCLKDVVSTFPDLKELADLPLGWRAERNGGKGEWKRTIQNSKS